MNGKKERLARLLYRSGLEKVLRRTAGSRLIVFNYHRIRPDDAGATSWFDDGVFGPTVSEFAQQVGWLARHARILSEGALLQAARTGSRTQGLSAMITFDDGYRDNYTLAFPVLKRLGIPAIFFVPTRPVTERRLGWWDVIAYLIKRMAKPQFQWEGQRLPLGNGQRREAIRHVQRAMKLEPQERTADLLTRLSAACEVALPDQRIQDGELMTWDQVRDVSEHGIAIGSHTHTHRVLATLDPASQEEELRVSKEILERETGRAITSLAYPVGGYQHFTRETQAIAARCGYELGFSFNTFINHWETLAPFDVRRVEGPRAFSLLVGAAVLPGVFARWN